MSDAERPRLSPAPLPDPWAAPSEAVLEAMGDLPARIEAAKRASRTAAEAREWDDRQLEFDSDIPPTTD